MRRTRIIFVSIIGIAVLVIVLGRMAQDEHPTSTSTSTSTLTPTDTSAATSTPVPTQAPTGAPPPTSTPTPGPEFVEDCDASPSPRWDTFGGGTWITANDRCMFLPTSGRELNIALIGFPYWQDYVVEADIHYTRADKDDYCGVLVLAQDERNYLLLSMGGRGELVQWWMSVNGNRTQIPETERRSLLKEGTAHHLRVEVSGGRIVTYLDGKEISRYGTRQFDSGLAGFVAYPDRASPGRLCAFDNFRISPLAP